MVKKSDPYVKTEHRSTKRTGETPTDLEIPYAKYFPSFE
jgi:hypothetical protein